MHTVPQSYLEAFAVDDPVRRTPGVWRFDRISGEAKILGIRDIEVVKDIYTVYDDDGAPDTGIETILCNVENDFSHARKSVLDQDLSSKEMALALSKDHWAATAKFVAAQLLRTPRAFQSIRDTLTAKGTEYDDNAPQVVMLELIQRWILRLARMRGMIGYGTDVPLLTSDNPAVAWKQQGEGFAGATQHDPDLAVSCPLSPMMMFSGFQTRESLQAVEAERNDIPRTERPSKKFRSHVDVGILPHREVKRLNALCVTNAHRYVYANYCGKPLLTFLRNRFFGKPAPVRARDLKPIGSPI